MERDPTSGPWAWWFWPAVGAAVVAGGAAVAAGGPGTWWFWPAAAAAVAAVGAAALTWEPLPAEPRSIPVLNHSFELPKLEDGAWRPFRADGWTISALPNPTESQVNGAGVFRPTSVFFDLPLPDGAQTCYSDGNTVSQTIGARFRRGRKYTLTVSVGRRKETPADKTNPKPWSNFGGYTIGLYAGTSPMGVVSSPIPASGKFVTATVEYFSPQNAPLRGEQITIILGSHGRQTNFDNVVLTEARY
jgi:hypothetical protein